jgi:hypothetical protein
MSPVIEELRRLTRLGGGSSWCCRRSCLGVGSDARGADLGASGAWRGHRSGCVRLMTDAVMALSSAAARELLTELADNVRCTCGGEGRPPVHDFPPCAARLVKRLQAEIVSLQVLAEEALVAADGQPASSRHDGGPVSTPNGCCVSTCAPRSSVPGSSGATRTMPGSAFSSAAWSRRFGLRPSSCGAAAGERPRRAKTGRWPRSGAT